jgi:hypothetical protein
MTGVGDLLQRTGMVAKVGYSVVGRSDDTVCGLHRARGDKERGFLG